MNTSLAAFQDAFVATLYGVHDAKAEAAVVDADMGAETSFAADARVAALARQPGFMVYRNTVFKGCVDALAANFPVIVRLVGDAWFRAAAMVYAQSSPPVDARMLHYGADIPAFLERFEPARELPYLADVARLDIAWTEAHVAADDTLADPTQLAVLTEHDMERVVFRPHAAARWHWFDTHPAWTIWRANREGVDLPDEFAWHAEGALLTRPAGGVQWQPLTRGGWAFMTACAQGAPLADAAAHALAVAPDTDFTSLLPMLLQAGAIAQIGVTSNAC